MRPNKKRDSIYIATAYHLDFVAALAIDGFDRKEQWHQSFGVSIEDLVSSCLLLVEVFTP